MPAVAIVNVEFLPVIATPPTVDVNAIALPEVPFVLVIPIVSADPTFVIKLIALAVLSLETIAI